MFINTEHQEIYRRLFKLLKPHIKKISIIFICILISSAIAFVIPFLGMKLTDDGLVARDFRTVVIFSLATLGLVILEQAIGLVETKYYTYINSVFPYTLSKIAFKHTLKLKISYFNNVNFAEIMNNISMDVNNISRICDRSMFLVVSQAFRIFGGLVGLLIIDWRLTILVVGIIAARYFIVRYLAKKRTQLFKKYIENNREYSAWYGDTVGGIREIKLWGLERLKLGEFIGKQRKIIKLNIRLLFLDKLNDYSESVLFQIITSSIYIFGAYIYLNDSMTMGGIFAFITYSVYVSGPISAILNIGYTFSNIIPSARRFFDFLDLEQEEALKPVAAKKTDELDIKGDIRFLGVNFSYNQGEPVLRDINIDIKKGERVAIIGANGSGKSSLINLLLRFAKPDSGKILLDGMDINEFGLREYRRLISVVSQELYLFDSTIENNIAMANTKRHRVIKVSSESGASDFIENIPEKYQYRVGRNGSRLSGGQKQKIAVTRALARASAKIMILDEATSNYDAESEIRLNELLVKAFKDKTILLISHRPEMLKNADKIIVINNGCVADVGKHEELHARSQLYRDLTQKNRDSALKSEEAGKAVV